MLKLLMLLMLLYYMKHWLLWFHGPMNGSYLFRLLSVVITRSLVSFLRPLYYYSRPYPHKFQPTMAIVSLCILLCGQRISSASPGPGKRPRACLSYKVRTSGVPQSYLGRSYTGVTYMQARYTQSQRTDATPWPITALVTTGSAHYKRLVPAVWRSLQSGRLECNTVLLVLAVNVRS